MNLSHNRDSNSNLSVVMPVRNGAKYISHSVQMIKDNCRSNDEIIIVEDGSTDETLLEINKIKKEISNLRVIETKGLGIVGALNLGILEATNPLIARFDVDDIYSPSRLNSQRKLLDGRVIGVFTDYKFVNESGSTSLGVMPSPVNPQALALSLVNSQRTAHPSSIFTKDAWEAAGRYRDEDFPAEDLSLWLRMLRVGQLVSVPEVHLNYRIHNLSVTSTRRGIAESRKEELICDIGFPRGQFNGVNWMEVYDSYENLILGPERRVLLIYDFITFAKKKKSLLNVKEFNIRALLMKENLEAMKRLGQERKLRQIFRNDLKPID